ncbi:unnamed protein product [Rotaria sp. Silwood2]|nr:unnamed protein product [Rotaria sp. Silwood2]
MEKDEQQMMSDNNRNYDNCLNARHCVIIDGNFGRHELFVNIHPYTLNQIAEVRNASLYKTRVNQAMNFMDDASNIHYHIFYNSSCMEIDEYYKALKGIYPESVWLHSSVQMTVDEYNNGDSIRKFIAVKSQYECNYIWIIHGIENYYEELIEQLKFNNNSKAIIASYSWLENLKDGSNRIEYLIDNKIMNLSEYQIERLTDQSNLNEPIEITTKSKKQMRKLKNRIICSFDDCKKRFKSVNALKNHYFSKHPTTQPYINYEVTTTSTSTEENLKKNAKTQTIPCDYDDCEQLFEKLQTLSRHQIKTHPIWIRCPFSEECLSSNERYLGLDELLSHILSEHTDSFPQPICPIAKYRREKYWRNWFSVLQHILGKHAEYLLNESIPSISEQQSIKSDMNASSEQTTPTTNGIPSWVLDDPLTCSYNDYHRSYRDEEALKRHEAYEHPVPLQCPFTLECQQSRKKYFGLWNLRKHIYSKHAPMFSQPICFDSECKWKENKPFQSWNRVLKHILERHLEAVGIIVKSATSSSTKDKHKIFKKCSYDNCVQLFKTREKFQYHLVTCHPFPLRCPYDSKHNKLIHNAKIYLGLMDLERHIKIEHSQEFQERLCFNNNCQKEKHFQDWSTLMNHILIKHWPDIRSN